MQERQLLSLSKRVFNTPQLIMTSDLQGIVDFMMNPVRTGAVTTKPVEVLKRSDFSGDDEYSEYQLTQIGIDPKTMQGFLHVEGTLVNRAGQTQACVELTSYESLKKTMAKQIEHGVKEVVMVIDSGGGEAYGVFATADKLRKMADENDVQLIAYVDGYGCSAAYALASAAHKVIANPQAKVGSIGVVVQLMNANKAMEKQGYSRTFVYAGDSKVPFDENGEFEASFIASIQSSINKTYDRFTTSVANFRSLQKADVVATQAAVYDADDAVKMGLVDELMETDEFFENYLPSLTSNPKTNQEDNMTHKAKADNGATPTADPITAVASLTTATGEVLTLADVVALQEKASQLEEKISELATATTRIQELEDQIENAKADALIATRKAQLEDVLGAENDQVATVLAATATLDDTAFATILGGYQAAFESKEKELAEVGKTPEKEAPHLTLEDRIKARLQSQA